MSTISGDRVEIVPVEAPARAQWRAAFADLGATWEIRRVWLLTALLSVGNRYRRTILGPWWMTLGTLFFILGLSLLRVGLGGGDLRTAIPYVGIGIIIFELISGGITTGANAYVNAGAQLSTARQPYSMYVMRSNTVLVVEFLHSAVVIVVIVLLFAVPVSLASLESLLALLLIIIGSLGIGLWLGPTVARFRDVGPLVATFMRLMFFLTPLFWSVDQVGGSLQVNFAWLNPFTYQVLAFRDPILGTSHAGAPFSPMAVTAVLAIVNVVIGVIVFARTRSRIPYWVVE